MGLKFVLTAFCLLDCIVTHLHKEGREWTTYLSGCQEHLCGLSALTSVSRGEQVDNLRLNQCVRAMYLGTGKERRPCQWCSSMPSSLISVVLGFIWVVVVVIVVLCCCCVV